MIMKSMWRDLLYYRLSAGFQGHSPQCHAQDDGCNPKSVLQKEIKESMMEDRIFGLPHDIQHKTRKRRKRAKEAHKQGETRLRADRDFFAEEDRKETDDQAANEVDGEGPPGKSLSAEVVHEVRQGVAADRSGTPGKGEQGNGLQGESSLSMTGSVRLGQAKSLSKRGSLSRRLECFPVSRAGGKFETVSNFPYRGMGVFREAHIFEEVYPWVAKKEANFLPPNL
jgi:hypothetical protein